jgi:hypothetical protein
LRWCTGDDFQLAVIVAVGAVRMVQMAIHQVINMVAMRHGFVSAVGTVSVGLLMAGAAVVRRAFLRIRRSHLNLMVVHMIAVTVMQVAIVKVIGVAVVFHGGVSAVWAVPVAVISRVFLVSVSHCFPPFENGVLLSRVPAECGAVRGNSIPFRVHGFIKCSLDGPNQALVSRCYWAWHSRATDSDMQLVPQRSDLFSVGAQPLLDRGTAKPHVRLARHYA